VTSTAQLLDFWFLIKNTGCFEWLNFRVIHKAVTNGHQMSTTQKIY